VNAEQLIQVISGVVLSFLVWNLRSTLVDLKDEIKDLKNMYQDILTNYAKEKDLIGIRKDIGDLYSKHNSLKVECAKHHPGP
jgi:hypothetical protein